MAYPQYAAELGDYYLDIINVSDTIPYGIVVHEYPRSHKNTLEWMGQKTRKISINCAFSEHLTLSDNWGNSAKIKPYYENHFSFLDYIKVNQEFTFVHPVYGTLKGSVQNITVTHDDSINYAAITFDFLVLNNKVTNYVKPITVQQSADLKEVSDRNLNLAKSARTGAAVLQQWTANTQLSINTLRAYANSVTSPAKSIANTIYYASDLPSQLIEAINFAIDRAIQPIIAADTAPAATINNMIVAITGLKNTFIKAFPDRDTSNEQKWITILGASRVSYETAKIYEEDNKRNRQQKRQSTQRAFDAAGNYVGSTDFEETMTIDELDKTCFDIKSLIDGAIQLDREQPELKNQGMTIQRYVNQIKLNRERIITKTEVPLQSMHQIAVNNDLDYRRAEQLIKLNPRIHNPTFAWGDIKILSEV